MAAQAKTSAGPQPTQPDVNGPEYSSLSYEEARDELLEVVRKLEAGGIALEESLSLWERGEKLAAVCEQRLEGARVRLDSQLAADGSASNAADAEDR